MNIQPVGPRARHALPRSRRRTAFAAGLALFLAACGGGGGGDEASGPAPATSVAGSAVKGLIRNGAVTVTELGERFDGSDGRVVGTGSTDGFGRYDVTLTGYRGGPALVVVAGRADGSTRVLCDVQIDEPGDDCGPGIAFGDEYPVDGNFRLGAVTTALPAGINAPRFNITAVSALIARTAATGANGDQTLTEQIRNATFVVNQLAAGIDVTATTPIDLTDPAAVVAATGDQAAYAALNAALLSLGSGDSGQAVIDSALSQLAQQIATGSLDNQQVHNLVVLAQTQLANVNAIDATGLLIALDETTGCADGSPCVGPYVLAEPPPSLNADAVTRAKAFSTDIRTTVENYRDAFDPDSNAFVGRVRDVGEFSGDAVTRVAEDIGEAVSQAVDLRDQGMIEGAITGQTSAGAPTSARYVASVSGGGSTENFRVFGVVGDSTVDITAVLPARNGAGDITGSVLTATLVGSARTTAGAGVSFELSEGRVRVVRKDGAIAADDETDGGRNIAEVSLDVTATLAQVAVENPLSFRGEVSLNVVQCVDADCAAGTVDDGTVIAAPTDIELVGTLTDSAGNTVEGTFAVAVPRTTALGFNYDRPYSSTNFVDGTVTISARTALIDPVPPVDNAQVTLAFQSTGWDDADEVPIGNATLTFVRGTTTLFRVTGGNSVADPGLRRLDITGTGGVTITLNNTAARPNDEVDLSGTVLVDGIRAGVIQQLDSGLVRVVYDDGSFETLFH